MCNIVQKCPMLSLPVGRREAAGSQAGFVAFRSKCRGKNIRKCKINVRLIFVLMLTKCPIFNVSQNNKKDQKLILHISAN